MNSMKLLPKKSKVFLLLLIGAIFYLSISGSFSVFAQSNNLSVDEIDGALDRVDQLVLDLQLNEALDIAINLKKFVPNDVNVRSRLFEIYLELGLLKRAEEELSFLQNKRPDTQTDFFDASLLFKKGQFLESQQKIDSVIENYPNFAPIWLLKSEVVLAQKYFREAVEYLDVYERIGGRGAKFLLSKANLIGKEYEAELNRFSPLSRNANRGRLSEMRVLLDEYIRNYGEDVKYFSAEAFFYFLSGEFEQAESLIEKALVISPQNEQLLKSKLSILLAEKSLLGVISFLKTILRDQLIPNQSYYYAVLGFAYFIKEKIPGSEFEVEDLSYLQQNVLPNLLQALKEDAANEKLRFLLDKIVKENLPFDHQLRQRVAQYHVEQGSNWIGEGQKELGRFALINAVQLAPQSLEVRSAYVDLLRRSMSRSEWLAHLEIIREFDQSFDDDYKRTTVLQLLERDSQRRLMAKENVELDNLLNEKKLVVGLLTEPSKWNLEIDFPYRSIIQHEMLKQKLSYSRLYEVKSIFTSELANNLANNMIDYYIQVDMIESEENLQLDVELFSVEERESLWKKTVYRSGNNRYFLATSEVAEEINELLPKVGQIVKMKGFQMIISLGQLHGVSVEDTFTILTSKGEIQNLKIKEVDARISLGEMRDALRLPTIKVGDKVVIDAKANDNTGNAN